MAAIYLRYRNLVEQGLVKSRQELKRLQDGQGFPLGRLLGPNTRVWTSTEITDYVASRPVKMPPHKLRGAAKAKHERKRKQAAAETDRLSETNELKREARPPP